MASFGFRYDYTLRRLQPADPIPPWLAPLIEQVEAFGGPGTKIAQILCTEYDTGVGIGWHRDKPHFDRIFGLSLGSPCKFRITKPVRIVSSDFNAASSVGVIGTTRRVRPFGVVC